MENAQVRDLQIAGLELGLILPQQLREFSPSLSEQNCDMVGVEVQEREEVLVPLGGWWLDGAAPICGDDMPWLHGIGPGCCCISAGNALPLPRMQPTHVGTVFQSPFGILKLGPKYPILYILFTNE